LIGGGLGGYLMESTEPDAIAAGIEQQLNQKKLEHRGLRGRDLIEDQFTFDTAGESNREMLAGITSL
jgi:hypothetical protein